jgi:2'-5' RNA ligase
MPALMSYGLTGLTAMLVIAFCFAYGDELRRTREKSSYRLVNNAHVTVARTLRFRGDVGKQQETSAPSLLQETTRVEIGLGVIYSGSFRNDRGTLEAFHG